MYIQTQQRSDWLLVALLNLNYLTNYGFTWQMPTVMKPPGKLMFNKVNPYCYCVYTKMVQGTRISNSYLFICISHCKFLDCNLTSQSVILTSHICSCILSFLVTPLHILSLKDNPEIFQRKHIGN